MGEQKTLKNWTLIVYFNKPWYEMDYPWHGNVKIGLFSPESMEKEVHLNPWTVKGAGDINVLEQVIGEDSSLANCSPMKILEELYGALVEKWADKSVIQEGYTKEMVFDKFTRTLNGTVLPDYALLEGFRAKGLNGGIDGLVENLKQWYTNPESFK